MKTQFIRLSLVFLSLLVSPNIVDAQSISLERIATGLSSPIVATYAPGDADRLFVAQRSGAILILDLNNPSQTPITFMTVPNVDTFFEGGLLGLAFHPDYESNGYFYVNYTLSAGGSFRTRIARFQRTSADTADPNSLEFVMEIPQLQGNHNAGWIGFSPVDEYLYIATGDGGGGNDPGNNGQDITNELLGKILRVDVDADDFPSDSSRNYAIPGDNPFVGITGDDEIFLYGMRNPFRCGFDRANGNLYMGDVGQGAREEISFFPAAGFEDRNMGWRLREGTIATPGVGGPQPADGIDPIYDYLRTGPFGGSSVTGGVVYRGPVTGLTGMYLFADFNSNNFWGFRYDGTSPADFDGDNHTPVVRWNDNISYTNGGSLSSTVCFGEDLAGNVYICDLFGGEIFKIVDGSVALLGDANGDGTVNLLDVDPFVQAISGSGYSYASDTNQDGQVNLLDVSAFVELLGGGG